MWLFLTNLFIFLTFFFKCVSFWHYFVIFLDFYSLVVTCSHSAKLRVKDVLRRTHANVLTSSGRPYINPIWNAEGGILCGLSLEPSQDVDWTIIHKMDFWGFFSNFLMPTAYQTMHSQGNLKIWYVSFCIYCCLRRLDLNRTFSASL